MCVCLNNYSNFGYLITALSIEGALWIAMSAWIWKCPQQYFQSITTNYNNTFNPLKATTKILAMHYY